MHKLFLTRFTLASLFYNPYIFLCVTLVSLLCHPCVTLVSLLCHSCVTLVSLLCHPCVTLVSPLCHSCATLVPLLCQLNVPQPWHISLCRSCVFVSPISFLEMAYYSYSFSSDNLSSRVYNRIFDKTCLPPWRSKQLDWCNYTAYCSRRHNLFSGVCRENVRFECSQMVRDLLWCCDLV